jgi:hypothetical protein
MLNKNNILAVIIAIAVLTVLFMAPEREITFYPADDTHLNAKNATTKRKMHEECGKCHFEGGEYPIPETHVKRTRCYGCHLPKPAEQPEGK